MSTQKSVYPVITKRLALTLCIGSISSMLTANALGHHWLKGNQMTQQSNNVVLTNAQVAAAVDRYFEGTRSMSARQWASAFALNAVVEDPVGTPLLKTPNDVLRQGEGFVGAFKSIGLESHYVHVNGQEAVAYWIGRGVNKDGVAVRFEGVNVFVFNQEAKIVSLRGFWSPANIRPGS
jgi:steroid Delta-isomerase